VLDHAPGQPACSPVPTGPAPGAAADLPGLDLAAQGNATALSRSCSTHRPAACRRGTRSAARCPASSSPCRQTGAAEQPGGSNRQLGRSKVRDNIERGIRRSSRAIQAPELTRQRLVAISHRTYPAWQPEGPELSNNGGYLGERRWRWPAPKISPTPVSVLPTRGRVAPTRHPTRVRTRPISGSTRTPNSHRRSRMDRNMTRGYPTSDPPHPGHTPSATSAMPDPQSPSIAAPPSTGRRRQTSGGGRQRRAATPW